MAQVWTNVRDWAVEQAREAFDIWISGGWAMIGIAAVSLVMFALGVHLHLALRDRRKGLVGEETWRRWLESPAEAFGPLGELLRPVAECRTIEDVTRLFSEARAAMLSPLERDLRVMRICVSAAPLVGLLGTVTGMLTTFHALADGGGGDETMKMVAGGISVALITTETGLLVALPGLFYQVHLARKFQQHQAFLAHVETVSAQAVHRREGREERARLDRAAREAIARTIRTRLLEARTA